jgi:hypothetical protein
MRLYHLRVIGNDGSIAHFLSRNMKDARKVHVRLKKEYGNHNSEIQLDSYDVPRNKDGLIDLLNNVT